MPLRHERDAWELERYELQREKDRAIATLKRKMEEHESAWQYQQERDERARREYEAQLAVEWEEETFKHILGLVKEKKIIVTAEYMKTLTPERKKLIVEAVCLSKV